MDINYRNLQARAKSEALEYMPATPQLNTLEAWQEYIDQLEAIESYDLAHESADSWDWVIYYGMALQVCSVMPSSVVSRAEEMVSDCGGVEDAFERGGIAGVACAVAHWVCFDAIQCAIETAQEELLEMAQAQMQNLESEVA
jgi:hypothetical protein